jgi:hypothetical protein
VAGLISVLLDHRGSKSPCACAPQADLALRRPADLGIVLAHSNVGSAVISMSAGGGSSRSPLATILNCPSGSGLWSFIASAGSADSQASQSASVVGMGGMALAWTGATTPFGAVVMMDPLYSMAWAGLPSSRSPTYFRAWISPSAAAATQRIRQIIDSLDILLAIAALDGALVGVAPNFVLWLAAGITGLSGFEWDWAVP